MLDVVLWIQSLLVFTILQTSAGDATCKSDICVKKSRLFCPRSKVILVTGVTSSSCDARSKCPLYIFNNVAKYCSYHAECKQSNILTASALCQSYPDIHVTYTCVKNDTSIIDRSCASTYVALNRDFGFLANKHYPMSTPNPQCRWSLSIPEGQEGWLVVYDLAASQPSNRKPTLSITTHGTQTNCTSVIKSRVVSVNNNFPDITAVKCSKIVNIQLNGSSSNMRILMYYYVIERGYNVNSEDGIYASMSSFSSSCKQTIDRNSRGRIFIHQTESESTTYAGFISTDHHTVAAMSVTHRSMETLEQRDTTMLFAGIGTGIAICCVFSIPLVCFCVWCLRRQRTLATKRSQQENVTTKGNNLHFHECTFITENPLDSPIYATIDENQIQHSAPIDCDPYCDVIDKLTNPPPPPRHLFSVRRDSENGSGHTYSEIQHEIPFQTQPDKLKVIVETDSVFEGQTHTMNKYTDAPFARYKGKLGRSHSEPCQAQSIFIFPTTITNCYA